MQVRALIRLLRPHHCVKNLLVLCPLFFNGRLFDSALWLEAVLAFVSFTCVASAVYAINDCVDARRDRLHPTKRLRPIASGAISRRLAIGIAAVLCATAVGLLAAANFPWQGYVWLGVYLSVNVAYSLGLKNWPIVDVALLSSGFLIRVMFGASVMAIVVSPWLYLTVLAGAFYLGLGKRRNELRKLRGGRARRVLRFYTVGFLDQHMNMCLGLTLTFYALWAANLAVAGLIWTVPLVLLILMRYGLAVDSETDGDPVEVLLHEPALLSLCVLYGVVLVAVLYLPKVLP